MNTLPRLASMKWAEAEQQSAFREALRAQYNIVRGSEEWKRFLSVYSMTWYPHRHLDSFAFAEKFHQEWTSP